MLHRPSRILGNIGPGGLKPVQPPAATLPPPVPPPLRARSYALRDTAVATTRRSSDLLARLTLERGAASAAAARGHDRAAPAPAELRHATCDAPALAGLQRRLERLRAGGLISKWEHRAAQDVLATSVCASRWAESVAWLRRGQCRHSPFQLALVWKILIG